MACSSGCPTQDHESFGACMRAKRLQIDQYSLVGNNQPLEKRKEHTLARFRECVRAGVTPPSPLKSDVERAEAVANAR